MEKFDLETAIALLPEMTGQEHLTKTLIDSIEYYSEMIRESSHRNLINFVLKTRLTQVAKFYLKANYGNIIDLIQDMKEKLITKK